MAAISVDVTHFTDPGCPWAYSARGYHAKLRWRFGDQLRWRLVMIGLSESAEQYADRGYTAERAVVINRTFAARFGMPFGFEQKADVSATGPGCRAVIAAGEAHAEAAFRALQLMHATTTGRLEETEAIRGALAGVPGLDADAVVARLDDPDVLRRYAQDRELARRAAGSPTEAQDRASTSDGPVRYTAPTLIFTHPSGRSYEVGGFQPYAAYDTALANLEPGLARRPDPRDPLEALAAFPEGLCTAEVAHVLRADLGPLDLDGTRERLLALENEGAVAREPVGSDALWRAA